MASPLVSGVSRIATTLHTSSLDDSEVESGKLAIGAMLYQYGAQLDAKILLALWVTGVTLPRVAEYLEYRQNAEKRRAKGLPVVLKRQSDDDESDVVEQSA